MAGAGEEVLLDACACEHHVDGDCGGAVDERQEARGRQRLREARVTRLDALAGEDTQEVGRAELERVDGDVDVGREARGAVGEHGLCAEDVPAQ